MKPQEALDRAIARGMAYTCDCRPGAVVERMMPEVREALSRLKSEHVNVRVWADALSRRGRFNVRSG